MLNAIAFRNKSARFIALSVALHIVLSTVAYVFSMRPRVRPVQSELKFYQPALLIPGGTHGKWTLQAPGRKKKQNSDSEKKTSNLARNTHPAPPAGAPVATTHESIAGDGTDAASADPAFPVFSPRPPVSDRSLLPTSDQQVVVDVKVSAVGDVLEATLVKGIGNGLDQIVLDTVKTWRFHPATINGNPVPTEAELIFPFNPRYPTTPS